MGLTPDITDQLIGIVRDTARTEIMPHFRNLGAGSIETKTSPSDLVTVADRAAETKITAKVANLMPQAVIIGEEAVSADPSLLNCLGSAELAVLIDPIDGTWNFASGLPVFGVMLAVIEAGQTSFGLLYDPVTDTWLSARAGEGVIRVDGQGRRQTVRLDPDAGRSAAFLPYNHFDAQTQIALLSRFTDVPRMTSLFCSCHEYWLLSHGAVDFGLSGMLNPWDHAAGELIYREAGGYAAMLDGSAYRPGFSKGQLLVARSRSLWNATQGRLADLLSPDAA